MLGYLGNAVFADQEELDCLPHCTSGLFCLRAGGLSFFGVLVASIAAFRPLVMPAPKESERPVYFEFSFGQEL